MFETRYLSWGISRILLFLMGLLPLLVVFSFHDVSIEWVISGFFLALIWVFAISRGYYQLTRIYFWGILSALTVELILALRDKNFIQMSLGILFVLSLLGMFYWLERQMVRAQYSPGIKWYEGLPQFFPKVQVEVFWDQKWHRASLRKIDDFGMFVFLQKSEELSDSLKVDSALKQSSLPIKIQYRDHFFEGDAKLQSVFYERWLGMGLQICPKDLYHFTQYSKVVQNLKGEGYAT